MLLLIYSVFSHLRYVFHNLSILSISILIVSLGHPSDAQELVQDTMVVAFPNTVFIDNGRVVIDSVIDQRQEAPDVVGLYEVDKFLVIPVDLVIRTKNPLAEEIIRTIGIRSDDDQDPHIRLFIDDFVLDKKLAGWVYPHYRLSASMGIHRVIDLDSTVYVGHLLYETSHRKPLFRDKLKKGYESVIRKWCSEFGNDLLQLSQAMKASCPAKLFNFRHNKPDPRRLHLYTAADVIYGTDHLLVDGAFYVSHREAQRHFFRSGGYHLRYRNADDFEAIEFGLSIDHLFYRLNRNLMLRGKSQFMFGLNRWKDTDTVEHTLYDVALLDYSLSQSLVFDSLDKRGVLFGIGILENVYYIYSKSIRFQLGLMFHAGLKL